jgi:hypothetical protein
VLLLEHVIAHRDPDDEACVSGRSARLGDAAEGAPRWTERVVFADAAARRAFRVERADSSRTANPATTANPGPDPNPNPNRTSVSFSRRRRRFRNPSEESFVGSVPETVEGCDLVRAFPGPPETAATLRAVSQALASDAARRREGSRRPSAASRDAGASGDGGCVAGKAIGASLAAGGDATVRARRVRTELERELERALECDAERFSVDVDVDFKRGRRRVRLTFTSVPMDALGCPATLVRTRDLTEEACEHARVSRRATAWSDAAAEIQFQPPATKRARR